MNKKKKPARAGLSKVGVVVLLCFCLTFISMTVWTVWGNTALEVTEISLSSDRLPEAFSGYRIAHLSDLHNAEFGKENRRLLAKLAECKPDSIMITGDLIDSNHPDRAVALHFVREVVKIAPTYYVSGNHEARLGDFEELRKSLADAGVTVLEDEAVTLEKDGKKVRLLGLSDPNLASADGILHKTPAAVRAKLEELTGDGEGYTILLSHRPELFETYAACGVDLVLAGHAHGGQIRLPLIGGLYAPGQGFFPKYDSGLYSEGTTSMVVSRGLGNSVIPLRFNNRPEIVLIELTGESPD